MRKQNQLVSLGLIFLVWFSFAFSCSGDGKRGGTSTGGNETASTNITIPGTYWRYMSLTKKGEKERPGSFPPDVEFCKAGTWSIRHYGKSILESGTYKVRGNRLIVTQETGTSFSGDFEMKQTGDMLELDDGEYVIRFKAAGKSGDC
jgi:hypothetical protein